MSDRCELFPQPVKFASVSFRRSPGPGVSNEHANVWFAVHLRGVVDETLGRYRCPDPLVDDPTDLNRPVNVFDPRHHSVADSQGHRWLRRLVVDCDVPAFTC